MSHNIFLFVLLVLVIFHYLVLGYYFEIHSNTANIKKRDEMTYNLAMIISQASQSMRSDVIISSITDANHDLLLNHYKINFQLGKNALFSNKINHHQDFTAKKPAVLSNTLSIKLNNGQWLNIETTDRYSPYFYLVMITLIDLSIIFLYLFYVFSLHRFRAPIQQFKISADKFGIEDDAEPVKIFGPRIVRETANAMNQMQQRIHDLIANRTKMLAAISHDLRTPLTRLRLRMHLLSANEQTDKIIMDLDEMQTMINSILSFASEDIHREKKVLFDINSLLFSLCDDYTDQGHIIHADPNKLQIPFYGSRLAMKRTFVNLIQNALKYADEVWVHLQHQAELVIILIEDNGAGIPESDLEKVFQPYYRSDTSKAKSSTGTGLGLSIVYEVIKAHNGTISLNNRHQGGLQAKIILPLQNNS
jgi:signal transduction histidine kinase